MRFLWNDSSTIKMSDTPSPTTLPRLTSAFEIVKKSQAFLEKSSRTELLAKGSAEALSIIENFVVSTFSDSKVQGVTLFFVKNQLNLHITDVSSNGSGVVYNSTPTKTFSHSGHELIAPDYFEQELKKNGYSVPQRGSTSLYVRLPDVDSVLRCHLAEKEALRTSKQCTIVMTGDPLPNKTSFFFPKTS